MAFDPITAGISLVNTIIDRVLPDKTQAAQAKAQLISMQVSGEFAQLQGQIQTNIAEAASGNKFAADWRPMFGYTCAAVFAYAMIIQPVAQCFLAVYRPGAVVLLPKLDMSALMPISLGLLGLSATHFADPIGKDK
jgi:Holin of 3TMs, for gene-transfer release